MPEKAFKLYDFLVLNVIPDLEIREVSPEIAFLQLMVVNPASNTADGHTDIYNVEKIAFGRSTPPPLIQNINTSFAWGNVAVFIFLQILEAFLNQS